MRKTKLLRACWVLYTVSCHVVLHVSKVASLALSSHKLRLTASKPVITRGDLLLNLLKYIDQCTYLFCMPPPSKQEELLEAVRQGDEANINAIINLGVSPNRASASSSPLIIAAEHGNDPEKTASLMKLLVEAGADPNLATSNRNTALRAGIQAADAAAVQALLALGADPNLSTARGSPLAAASATGDCDIISTLLEAGADLGYEAKDGTTALLAAVRENRQQAVKLLLRNGADPSKKNADGLSAIGLSEQLVLPEVYSLLAQSSIIHDAERAIQDSELRQADARKQVAEEAVKARQEADVELARNKAETQVKVSELKAESEELLKRLGLTRNR